MSNAKTILISVAVGTVSTLVALWIWNKYQAKQLEEAAKPMS